jgi:hypothetical protein
MSPARSLTASGWRRAIASATPACRCYRRGADAGKQRLTHKFMGEDRRPGKSLGARDDYPHLLRLFQDGEKFVNLDLADGS